MAYLYMTFRRLNYYKNRGKEFGMLEIFISGMSIIVVPAVFMQPQESLFTLQELQHNDEDTIPVDGSPESGGKSGTKLPYLLLAGAIYIHKNSSHIFKKSTQS